MTLADALDSVLLAASTESLLKQKGPAFAGPFAVQAQTLSRHSFLFDLEAVFLESLELFAFSR